MPSVNLSPIGNSQVVDSAGDPATGWKWNTYLAGTSTPQATYTTADGDVAQSNPVVINSLGLPTTGIIFLVENIAYKLVLTDADDVVQKTYDDITGVAIVSAASFTEWISYTASPTYISATSFSVAGDQRSIFNVGRRLKTTNTAGTIYSTISAVAYTSLTTITVVNDSGTLDSGLSSVIYGIISSENGSLPIRRDVIPAFADVTDPTKWLRVDVANVPAATVVVQSTGAGGILPAGIGPLPYAGSSIPSGWLECDGSEVSRTTYAALYTAIADTWGDGDGATTFNLPDMRGKTIIGDGTGTTTEDVTASSGDGFTVASNNTKWITGMAIVLSDLTGFTTSATAGPTYYIYRASATNVRLCSTLAIAQNATTGSMETISGTGTATLTHTYTARTLGEYGGEQGHAQSSTEALAHLHAAGTLAGSFTTWTDGGGGEGRPGETAGSASSSHGVTITGSTASTGGNAAANIMQPFAVAKYIISY
jgi:microcystin-dependent protein